MGGICLPEVSLLLALQTNRVREGTRKDSSEFFGICHPLCSPESQSIQKTQMHPLFAWDFVPTTLFTVLPSESLPKQTPQDDQGGLCNRQGHMNTGFLNSSCPSP